MKFENYADVRGRFRLRELQESDAVDIEAINQKLFYAYIRHKVGVAGYMKEALEAKNQEPRTLFYIAIVHPIEDRVIGMVDIVDLDRTKGTAEVGYFLSPEFQRQGIASTALGIVVGAIHRLGLLTLTATADPDNDGSMMLLESIGFMKVGLPCLSEYLGDPDNPAHYSNGELQFRPRQAFEGDMGTFLQRLSNSRNFTRPAMSIKADAYTL